LHNRAGWWFTGPSLKESKMGKYREIFSCAKVAFPSESAAKRKISEIKNINEKRALKYGHKINQPLRVYECKICGGFHLTSKP